MAKSTLSVELTKVHPEEEFAHFRMSNSAIFSLTVSDLANFLDMDKLALFLELAVFRCIEPAYH